MKIIQTKYILHFIWQPELLPVLWYRNLQHRSMILEARSYNTWKTRNCEKIPWFTKKIILPVCWRYQKILACKSSILNVEHLHAGIFWYLQHRGSIIFFECLHGQNMVLKMAFLYNRNLGFRDFGIFGLGFGLPTSFTIL